MATPPYSLNIDYFVGDTLPISLGISDTATGLAFDLTGVLDAWFIVKETMTTADEDAVISRRLGSGITVGDARGDTTGGEMSVVDITPNATETAVLEAGSTYFAYLRIKDATGHFVTLAQGYFNVGDSAPASLS